MMRSSRFVGLRDERGISAVFLAVTLVALFAVSALAIDAGSLWTARRNLITGTDAAALDAARYFNSGGGDPCSSTSVSSSEDDAKNVLLRNNPYAIHNNTDTPNGYQVTLAAPCGSGSYVPGKVRFDGRLNGHQTLSGLLGISKLQAFSSSTAAWGYITSLGTGSGLRPISICDQSSVTFPNPLPAAPAAPYYTHFALWNMLQHGTISQSTYDTFFGSDVNNYPSASSGFANGEDRRNNPNEGKNYVVPNGSNGHHTIHRITMPDPNCGVSPGNRIWVDLTGTGPGGVGTSTINQWLLNGYDGEVDLTPHNCNPSNGIPTPQNCGTATGNKGGAAAALGTITCDAQVLATSCPYVFPIVVVSGIVNGPGNTAEYVQVAFLYVVLRGFGQLTNTSLQMDFEFVRIQTDGNIGVTPPSPTDTGPTGVQLCGADHDTRSDRCGF